MIANMVEVMDGLVLEELGLGAARNGYVSRLQGRAAEVEDRIWPRVSLVCLFPSLSTTDGSLMREGIGWGRSGSRKRKVL